MELWKLTWCTLRPEIVCQPGLSFIINPKFPAHILDSPQTQGRLKCVTPQEISHSCFPHMTHSLSEVWLKPLAQPGTDEMWQLFHLVFAGDRRILSPRNGGVAMALSCIIPLHLQFPSQFSVQIPVLTKLDRELKGLREIKYLEIPGKPANSY